MWTSQDMLHAVRKWHRGEAMGWPWNAVLILGLLAFGVAIMIVACVGLEKTQKEQHEEDDPPFPEEVKRP